MPKPLALVTVALSLFLARPAEAQSRSWAAVKKSVPPGAAFVFGANLAPIRKTATYAAGLNLLLAENDELKQGFDLIKTTCQIDVPAAVADITVVMKDDEKPLIVLGLDGLDEAKVVACMEKLITSFSGNGTVVKLSAKKKGKITEYSAPGEAKKLYAAWLATDVLAFAAEDPRDKGLLTKMLTGGAPRGAMGAMIGKLSTAAPIWFAVSKKEKEAGIGTILGGYGTVDISGATITGTGHLVLSRATEATAAMNAGNAALDDVKAKAAKQPAVKKVLDTVKLIANGKELDVTGSVADKEILTIAPQLESIF